MPQIDGKTEVLIRVLELPNGGTDWGIYIVAGIAAVASIVSAYITVASARATQARQDSIEMARMVQSLAMETIREILTLSYGRVDSVEFNALRLMAIAQLPSASDHTQMITSHLNKVEQINSEAEFEVWKDELGSKFSAFLDEFWGK